MTSSFRQQIQASALPLWYPDVTPSARRKANPMKWFLGVILILLVALVLESGLLAYAMYVLLGLMVLSRFLTRSWIGHLEAGRECANLTAEVSDTIDVSVTIKSTGWLPVPWVLVEDLLPRKALSLRFPRLRVLGKRIK